MVDVMILTQISLEDSNTYSPLYPPYQRLLSAKSFSETCSGLKALLKVTLLSSQGQPLLGDCLMQGLKAWALIPVWDHPAGPPQAWSSLWGQLRYLL